MSSTSERLERLYKRRGECSVCGKPNTPDVFLCKCKKQSGNWYSKIKIAQGNGTLGQALTVLRSQLAAAAQGVYNTWDQDADGMDMEVGGGGICDEVSRAMESVIHSAIPNAETTEGGQDGDDHAWLIVYNQTEAYGVDIPPGVYEQGGGYNWTKIPDVVMDANDVQIWPMNRADFQF